MESLSFASGMRSKAVSLGCKMLLAIVMTLAVTVAPHIAMGEGDEGDFFEETPFIYQNHPINLLEPLDPGTTQLQSQPGLGTALLYFNTAWPWVIGSAAGIAVLQALVGGVQIMMSGGKEWKEEGKNRLMWALAGLLMIGLSGVILETLNPLFFRQV